MFGRNVDFFAVFLIAVIMLGFSQAAAIKVPDLTNTIQFQRAINAKPNPCPIQREVLSRIDYFLNH